MLKKIILIQIIICFVVVAFAGCTEDTVVINDTEGTLIDVQLIRGKITIEFGNNSKSLLEGFERYDRGLRTIDWYDYLKSKLGTNIKVTYVINRDGMKIISVEDI